MKGFLYDTDYERLQDAIFLFNRKKGSPYAVVSYCSNLACITFPEDGGGSYLMPQGICDVIIRKFKNNGEFL